MTICKIRVKPFDVMIMNRIANMTSVDCATQLVDEGQVKWRKGWHTTDQGTKTTAEEPPSWKQFAKLSLKLLLSILCFENYQQPSILNIIKFLCYF